MKNSVALITGGAKRIGAAITKALHSEGFSVLIHAYRNQEAANQLADSLNHQRKDSAAVIIADLQNPLTPKTIANQAIAHFGRVDVLINNASTFIKKSLSTMDNETWAALMDTNLKAPYFLSQALLPTLRSHQGTIINITDIHATHPLSEHSAYCISKAGLTMMTLSLARDLAPHIRVNAIAPGAIAWPEGENSLDSQAKTHILNKIPLARSGEPEDIVQAVRYLIFNAPYVTGQILNIDGGRHL